MTDGPKVLNVDDFLRGVADSNVVVLELWVAVTAKIALDLLRLLVYGTPVLTGRARGGWQVSIERIPDSFVERLDREGSATIAAGAEVLLHLDKIVDVHLSNGVAYIRPLDEGHSPQAENGITEPALATIRAVADVEVA